MSEDQFRKAIVFREREIEGIGTEITASFEMHAKSLVTDKITADRQEVLRHCREILREALLRNVYEDRRRELCEALMELHRVPVGSREYHETIDNIVALAKRQ